MIISKISSICNFINTINVFLAINAVSDGLGFKKSSFLVNFHVARMIWLCFNRCFLLSFEIFNINLEIRLRKVKIHKALCWRKLVVGRFLKPLVPEYLLLLFFSWFFLLRFYEWKFFLRKDYSNLVILCNVNVSSFTNLIQLLISFCQLLNVLLLQINFFCLCLLIKYSKFI